LSAIKIEPKKLSGKVYIPPSKSLLHRAVIAAGLSCGASRIENVLMSQDIKATCRVMRNLGVDIAEEDKALVIQGKGCIELTNNIMDCEESGSTLRFLIPISLLTGSRVTFTGKGKLIERPLNPYFDIFNTHGIKYDNTCGKLPLTVEGSLKAGIFYLPGDISSQFITGLLFALPLVAGDSKIVLTSTLESRAYVDLTIDTLKMFGISVKNKGYSEFLIKGNQAFIPRDFRVEGDFSQAAFWIAAGILGGKVDCLGLESNSLQGDKAIATIVKEMCGDLVINENLLTTHPSILRGTVIDASQIPDLVPILTVLGALSSGTTVIKNAGRLRIKESDRLRAISTELNKLGADIKEKEDSLIIQGKKHLIGGTVDSWNDHRIAMALAVASIKCNEPVIITNSDCVKKSYPDFFKDFVSLGGVVSEWNMG
jgi:3-phosphoshikimate 1-carboxyvinyltransferase